jgi:hypothetical protein
MDDENMAVMNFFLSNFRIELFIIGNPSLKS